MILRFVRSSKVQLISNTLRSRKLALSRMSQTFEQALTASIQEMINQQVTKQVQQMAANLEKNTEGKVTAAQVIELWNQNNPAVTITSAKSATPGGRVKKTDDRKCTFTLLSGPRKEQACGKPCLIGAPGCSNHKNKMIPAEEKVVAKPAAKEAKPAAAAKKEEKSFWELSATELSKLTVKTLKEFCTEHKITVTGHDKKADIVAKIEEAQKKRHDKPDEAEADEGDDAEEAEEEAEDAEDDE